MIDEEKEHKKSKVEDAEEVKAVLEVVSKEIPALIKGIIGSVFSEEAGRDMGKAAGAFYKELKESGMPDEIAVKMTENYISVFTSLGDIMTKFSKGEKSSSEIEKEIERRIKKKLAEKGLTEEE
ncbi:MAG: hypothetical protein OEW71_03160 [Candidatus Bathyarchaeota archaeon]|nr:hypothetical protein [Candidatus Bathyarchaeota archaeon]